MTQRKGTSGDGKTHEVMNAIKYTPRRVKRTILLNLEFRMVGADINYFQSQLQVNRAIITNYNQNKLETGPKLMSKLAGEKEGWRRHVVGKYSVICENLLKEVSSR